MIDILGLFFENFLLGLDVCSVIFLIFWGCMKLKRGGMYREIKNYKLN